ncbi:MAG TPA: hypothetical protein VN132_01260 [Bdellovibrio sp.]|nr:hypothetical protein [Bdellovibrio sp.]
MKLLFGFILFAILFTTNFAFAGHGLVYENSGGAGYIFQGEKFQFKVLGNFYSDNDHDYKNTANLKLAFGADIAKYDELKLYAGLGFWKNYVDADLKCYQTRTDALLGLRYNMATHWQFEFFMNAISYYDGSTITDYDGTTRHSTVGTTGVSLFRTGAISVAYLF